MNSFGRLFRLTSFGESHGDVIGGVVDGMPAGIEVDMAFVQHELDRRRPGQSAVTSQRKEADRVELLSGVFEGKSTGCPIAFVVRNENQRPEDYEHLKDVFRPSHADYTYYYKYGVRDYRGGGRASARVTIARQVGGALAKLVLRQLGVKVVAFTSQVGDVVIDGDYQQYDLSLAEENPVRCPDPLKAEQMERLIATVRADGDSVGGTVTCVVSGCPPGLGEPEFGKLHAALGAAMLSINAVKGFEYGTGFASAAMRGSESNDPIAVENGVVHMLSNHSGGIQGGISNGEDIYMRIAFKAAPTIQMAQRTVDKFCNSVEFSAIGRHDPCVVPRAVPIVEAMAAMTILDGYLLDKVAKFC